MITYRWLYVLLVLFISCKSGVSSNTEMSRLLSYIESAEFTIGNPYCSEARLAYYDSLMKRPMDSMQYWEAAYFKARALLEVGKEQESINLFEETLRHTSRADYVHTTNILKALAIANMRLGERINCINNHNVESCIFPIQGGGIHKDKTGSSRAIELYEKLLKADPYDIESRWLLNIAYMTIGEYPQGVPSQWLIGPTDTILPAIKPFVDVAPQAGLDIRNLAGGSVVDDFNNDGYLDIITSSLSLSEAMHYQSNNGDGTFTDLSASSGLQEFKGGLNIMQTDYNNDGFKDVFVLRGAWKGKYGREPNSLLQNNGDGTFTDVTKKAGLLSFHPTQTATWNDFNNDGWLDVFIGNESTGNEAHPCEFYINNKDGTFTEMAVQSGVAIVAFVKGVTSGDYDNDGRKDIFLSTLGTRKVLLRNEGMKNGVVHFTDVTEKAGLHLLTTRTFPTWFWDYDNDGWLDILVCGYQFERSLAYHVADGILNGNNDPGRPHLFRNKGDGTFENVTGKMGLNKVAFTMGSNFGDIDNDGYLDMYLGTGSPVYESLVPNKLFKNEGGKRFVDITSSARVGNLQKGHGVSFADLDNDGDEDIYAEMGGALTADVYENSLFLNPGQSNNNWINLILEGTTCNKAAIGAKIKVTIRENGVVRSIYRDVTSGGSFGCNPLMQHIGIGNATVIDSIGIQWPVSNTRQVFTDIQPGETVKIKEGASVLSRTTVNKLDFTRQKHDMHHAHH